MLKRLTICLSQGSQSRQAIGEAYADAPGFVPRVCTADCVLPAGWSTLRRHRSLHAPCSGRVTARSALRAGTVSETAYAPGHDARLPDRGTVRMAKCAGWTEVVIPRGTRFLFNLPVDPHRVSANTRSGHRPNLACPAMGLAGDGGADVRWGPDDQWLVSVSQFFPGSRSTLGCQAFSTMNRISCQNNYEVTL